ncbi:PAB-dependent poly(A)-specific ribonuclease subunit 3 [Chlorella sorokiniana]|uniref:PAB-dependent poly(A)-specific ribonuclease subunit 3 n=1 Tax=Chlorella sorokiniana TaxID=3076 RepID=A0A2P6TVL5_CHLSO|nr:PAB-dependent poly(A)-specific ribonuclease subunit 3 [Chlorella sorokiniana]|eukprot:PRW58104.1 PAB-dependent poly(A)-specific ribonuclease subunit 3 [Chlorella sorokiniana]
MASPPGLDPSRAVNAPAFVPGAPPGLAPTAAAAAVAAKPFVPGSSGSGSTASAVTAKPFVPGGSSNSNSSAGLAKSASSSSLTSGAVHAPIFVPGTSGSGKPPVAAKPFVPGSSSGRQSASGQPPRSPPMKPGRGGSRPGSQQGQGRSGTPDLPEGDDLLGMSAVTPGDARDVATQAAEMFKSLNPFGAQQQAAPPAVAQQHSVPQVQLPPAMAAGGGAGPQPSGGREGGWSRPDSAGGRSGSAGGRGGRGGRGRRPGNSRPSAAYTTAPGRMQAAGQFISEQLRGELQQRSYLIQAQVSPEAEGDLGVPQIVGSYHTLYPLEDVTAETTSQALGVSSQVAKAISSVDGQAYVLRRIDGRQVIPTAELLSSAEAAVARWEPVANHPNLVGLRDAFVSADWDGSPSLFFAHDYHPGSFNLEQAHIMPTQTPQGLMRNPANEEQLWSYLVQLTSALRCIHSAGLAARPGCLMPSKVLVTSTGRVRIGSLGVPEVLTETAGYQDMPQLQRDDLAALGNLLLLLACVGRGVPPSLDYLTAHFSREFCHVVAGLLAASEGSGFASWRSLLSALGDRIVDELDSASLYSDALLGEVQREADNGRLLRLLFKLNYICERPELGGDSQWAETGDRYLLKLFRDFLFHQVDEEGAPMLDWGLAVEALNKVDAGVPEKVLLMSRDEMSMLVVSYSDIRRCIASCYEELRGRASTSGPSGPGGMQRSRSRPSMQQQY